MHILHLIDHLDRTDPARQLRLLVLEHARQGHHPVVCCIGRANPHPVLPSVHVLGWRRWLDGRALWRLRALLRGRDYDLIHVWGLAALRMLAVAAADSLPRAVITSPLPAAGRLSWWDRQLLRRVRCLLLASEDERQNAMQQGLGDILWRAVPTAAAPAGSCHVAAWASAYPRRIVCAGRLERGSGFREAIWAVDILRYVFPDAHLLIAGDGPFRADLASMIQRLDIRNAHLLGEVDPAEALAAAHACWVPSVTDHGRQSAVEAMALGLPVVATDVPCLRTLIRDGETGLVVPRGDPVALARQTRWLFAEPGHRARLGAAARDEAAVRFALPHIAARWLDLYNDMVA
jgi:glycosyltransferase involved in cell wall biosynthesis